MELLETIEEEFPPPIPSEEEREGEEEEEEEEAVSPFSNLLRANLEANSDIKKLQTQLLNHKHNFSF